MACPERSRRVSFQEARFIALEAVRPLPSEEEALPLALGRVLAEAVIADRDLPPSDCSAVDGFAIRLSDAASPEHLQVIGEAFAGGGRPEQLREGEAIRITTGAILPEGAEAVVKEEEVAFDGDRLLLLRRPLRGENVRRSGREVPKGACVLSEGTPLGPLEIGRLSSVGRSKVAVFRRPKVAVLAIGDELRELEEADPTKDLVASNSYMLAACLVESGALPVRLGVARDDLLEVSLKLTEGLHYDAVVTAGGSGRGEKDLVRETLKAGGCEVLFDRVPVRPGGSSALALKGGVPIFCLPGGPGAAFLAFEAFARPAVRRMLGFHFPFRPRVKAVAVEGIPKEEGITLLILGRVEWERGRCCFARTREKANAVAILPEEVRGVDRREEVEVELLL